MTHLYFVLLNDGILRKNFEIPSKCASPKIGTSVSDLGPKDNRNEKKQNVDRLKILR